MPADPPLRLDITLSQANVILGALAEQPWRVSNDLIGLVHRQVNAQMQALQGDNVTRLPASAGE